MQYHMLASIYVTRHLAQEESILHLNHSVSSSLSNKPYEFLQFLCPGGEYDILVHLLHFWSTYVRASVLP